MGRKRKELDFSSAKASLDIQVFDNYGDGYWAQGRYLVHGFDDVLWTDDLNSAVEYLKSQLERLETSSARTS